jgi:ABC-type transport system involved in multi-copper enzyme maturation permease subunit
MMSVVRSELVRLRRPGVLLGWGGLTAMFAVLINVVMFQVVEQGSAPAQDGPGVSFPGVDELLSSSGIVSGLAAASSLFGVVALAFWAIAAASDYSSGLVRVLAAAEPRRWRLLVGKWIALAVTTAGSTLVALLVNLVVAPVAASAGGFEPTAWGEDLVPTLLSATVNLYLSLLVWGTIGLALAVVTRSAGIAIGIGVGYVLLLEAVITAAASSLTEWLPGTTISALAHGGTAALGYQGALGLGLAYVAVAAVATLTVHRRRDITD